MVYDNRNLAYDLRLFEEEEIYSSSVKTKEKKQSKNEPKPKKQNKATIEKKEKNVTNKRTKIKNNRFLSVTYVAVLAAMIVLVVGMIIYGRVRLTELNQQISHAQSELSQQQSLYTQLEMKVDASISTSVVEKYAQEDLGMSKVANSQKEFVSLSQGDKVELTLEANETVFDKIADAISSLWNN